MGTPIWENRFVITVRRFFKVSLLLMMASWCAAARPGHAQLHIDVETGLVFSGYNDIRIPGDSGTLLSLSRELKIDPASYFRLRLICSLAAGHNVEVLVAPLRLEARGSVDRPVRFQAQEFAPGVQLISRYRFDSYRATYRYDFYRGQDFEAGLGFTAKIRDASITMKSTSQRAEKRNTGFVPLFHFRVTWMFTREFGLLMEGDALAAPQGRAEDVLLAFRYRPDERLGIKLGYRVLEGGADNDEVYNFTLVHFLVAGAVVTF